MDELLVLLFLVALIGIPIWLVVRKFKQARAERERLQRALEDKERQMQELQRENVLLETHHLKFQMQPHALNNILAELKAISRKLERGMGSLSATLEYILYRGQTNLVTVADEVAFVRQYIQLHEMFVMGLDAVQFDEVGIDQRSPYYGRSCIPHLVTGYLLENAFKHGDKKHPEFLRIKVKLNDKFFQVHVANRVLPKPREVPGGLGLHNMKKRMDILLPGQWRCDTHQEGDVYHAILTIQFAP
jgi:LytS/YehU family sensor histidine kinase